MDNILTQLMITSHPYSENAKELVESLLRQQRFLQGEDPNPSIDRAGLEALKSQLGKSKMIKVRQYNKK